MTFFRQPDKAPDRIECEKSIHYTTDKRYSQKALFHTPDTEEKQSAAVDPGLVGQSAEMV